MRRWHKHYKHGYGHVSIPLRLVRIGVVLIIFTLVILSVAC